MTNTSFHFIPENSDSETLSNFSKIRKLVGACQKNLFLLIVISDLHINIFLLKIAQCLIVLPASEKSSELCGSLLAFSEKILKSSSLKKYLKERFSREAT